MKNPFLTSFKSSEDFFVDFSRVSPARCRRHGPGHKGLQNDENVWSRRSLMAKWMPEMDSTSQTTSSMNFVGFLVIWLFDFEGLLLLKRDGEGS